MSLTINNMIYKKKQLYQIYQNSFIKVNIRNDFMKKGNRLINYQEAKVSD
jgi:hypothetical protein